MINKKEIREMILADVVRMYGPDELKRNAEHWESEIQSVFAFYEGENEKPAEPATKTDCNSEAEAEAEAFHVYEQKAWDSYISNGLCFNNNYNNKRI